MIDKYNVNNPEKATSQPIQQKTSELPKEKVEAPAVTTFDVNNIKLKEALTPFLPQKKPGTGRAPEINFETVVNVVNNIQDKDVREKIQELLSEGLVTMAQEYMGMSDGSRFGDNRATGKLDQSTLDRMKLPRLLKK